MGGMGSKEGNGVLKSSFVLSQLSRGFLNYDKQAQGWERVQEFDKEQILSVPQGYYVELNFTMHSRFPLPCLWGSNLEIRDGSNQSANFLGEFCGDYGIGVVRSSLFEYDKQAQGWERVQELNEAKVLSVPQGHYVELNFTMRSKWPLLCLWDLNLEIRDGSNQSANFLGEFCGDYGIGVVRSSGRYMWLKLMRKELYDFAAFYTDRSNDETVNPTMDPAPNLQYVFLNRTFNMWCPVKGAPAPYIVWRKDVNPTMDPVPNPQYAFLNRTSNLWCPVKGAPAPYIVWRKDGDVVQNSTSITFELNITSKNNVNYSCEVRRDGEVLKRNISLRI
ncbi:hypothetical protein pdam_00018482, partial [Pocillopora damicornis]